MNEKQRNNEEQIFKAIQDLKDSVFGLKQPYIRYCYTYSEEEGYRFCATMADAFADELSAAARRVPSYREELADVMPLFFRMIPRLLAAICASGDWIFVSFRKLADTALKKRAGGGKRARAHCAVPPRGDRRNIPGRFVLADL